MAEGVGVFAEPEQLVLNVTKDDRFIVIASDGVFEFITSHQVCGRCILQPLSKVRNIFMTLKNTKRNLASGVQ